MQEDGREVTGSVKQQASQQGAAGWQLPPAFLPDVPLLSWCRSLLSFPTPTAVLARVLTPCSHKYCFHSASWELHAEAFVGAALLHMLQL